ncbi:hypothetical protein [Embleya sp. NPDC050493]|uniref:hypothetical protein n=1 Tax=Embleya sp. NPDC050493 TaxID=3363989 RepID=UPI003791EA44
MSFRDYVSSRREQLWIETWTHASAVLQSVVIATLIGVVVAVATYRSALAPRIAIGTTARVDGENAINAAWAGTSGVVLLALLFDAGHALLGRPTVSRGIRG